VYDDIVFSSPEQELSVRAQQDRAAIRDIRSTIWAQFIYSILEKCFYVIAFFAAATVFLLVSIHIQSSARVPIGLAISGLVFSVCAFLISRKYARAIGASLGLVAIGSGIVLVASPVSDNKWVTLVGAGLLTGGTLIEIGVILGWMLSLAIVYWYGRVRRHNARMMTLDMLGYIADRLDETEARTSISERDDIVDSLEYVAHTIEHDVIDQIPARDDGSREWFLHQLRGVAENVRQMKRAVLAPSDADWKNLLQALRHQIVAVATDDWKHALYEEPPAVVPKSARDRLLGIARSATVALLPGAAVLAANLTLDLGPGAFRWAVVIALAWALLSILLSLDPSFRDKLETAQSLASSWREVTDQEKRPRGDPDA
jgi:hypothetical protein